jgi:hypothetical protein
MHIHKTALLDLYLGSKGRSVSDLQELRGESNFLTLIGNILYALTIPFVGAIVVGVLGLIASWVFWTQSPGITAAMGIILASGVAGFAARVGVEYVADNREFRAEVGSSPKISYAQFLDLRWKFCEILNVDATVVDGLSVDELKGSANDDLYMLAASLLQAEESAETGKHLLLRDRFRREHAVMYQLGLVPPQWDRYFSKSPQ